jgi:ribonuclease E
VTEITSLGLVQMTRKRIGQGLLEAFSETCDHCKGRGVVIQTEPVPERPRPNVAEKVRAVAASTRTGAPDGASRVVAAVDAEDAALADAAFADAALPDEELDEVEVAGLPDTTPLAELDSDEPTVRSDFAAQLAEGELSPEEAEPEPPSARRRARRGSSRRRTRP